MSDPVTGWRLVPDDGEDWAVARRSVPSDCAGSTPPADAAPAPIRVVDTELTAEWATWTLSDGTLLSRPLPRPVC